MDKSAVAMVVRNESKYIEECICFNHLIGFDRIIVVIHDCQDDTEEKVRSMKMDNIDVINLNYHEKDIESCINSFQRMGYEEVFRQFSDKVEWMAFFDADEYLWIKKDLTINDLLKDMPDDVGSIKIPWMVYGHNNQVISVPQGRTRLNYFTTRQKTNTMPFFKSILRTSMARPERFYYTHAMDHTGRAVDFSLKERPGLGNRLSYDESDPPIENQDVVLCHYHYGSMEDWVLRYYRRRPAHLGLNWDVEHFTWGGFKTVDNRMLKYKDKLKSLLKDK